MRPSESVVNNHRRLFDNTKVEQKVRKLCIAVTILLFEFMLEYGCSYWALGAACSVFDLWLSVAAASWTTVRRRDANRHCTLQLLLTSLIQQLRATSSRSPSHSVNLQWFAILIDASRLRAALSKWIGQRRSAELNALRSRRNGSKFRYCNMSRRDGWKHRRSRSTRVIRHVTTCCRISRRPQTAVFRWQVNINKKLSYC